ncbi:MAG: hypothetical protein QOF21_787 [Actinomycetota bacterium]
MRRAAFAGALVGLLLLAPLSPTRAAAPSRQGWWEGASPLAAVFDLLATLGVDLSGVDAVDVPPDGLLVQGGTADDQPAAYAALAFDVGSSEVTGPLRLVTAPSAASVPGSPVKVCPLDNPTFTPAQGGAPENAPGYDCFGAVAATIADDGAYLVDVVSLQRGDTIAVAVLPAATSTRVVFQAPGKDALPLRAAAPAPARVSDGLAGVVAPLGSTPGIDSDPGGADVSVDTEPGSDGGNAVAALPSSATTAARPTVRVLIFGVLAALAAASWFTAGRLGLRRSERA